MPYACPIKQRAAHNEAVARWRLKSKKRYAAQQAVKAAVKSGRIVPWPGCACCPRKRGLEAHHCDYDQPLDVVWLCMRCHKAAHAIVGFRDTEPCNESSASSGFIASRVAFASAADLLSASHGPIRPALTRRFTRASMSAP